MKLDRHRSTILVVVGVLAVVLLLAWAAGNRGARFNGALDPTNPGPDGARAVAQVLEQRGVELDIVRNEAAYRKARIDARTTVVITAAQFLSDRTAGNARTIAAAAGAIVVVRPGFDIVDSLGLPMRVASDDGAGQTVGANCRLELMAGLTMQASGSEVYSNRSEGPPGTVCFGPKEAGPLWQAHSRQQVLALGADEVLANNRITRADNAAIALRLLGQHDHLVWYVASAKDLMANDTGSLPAQLPRWLEPSLFMLTLVMLAVMYWRGRRLGRIVFEPLPVVIKAVETTLSRGRLYRKVRDRDHAAAILRRATRNRLLAALRLPPDTPPQVLASSLPSPNADALLTDGPVDTDRQLLDLAQALADLEKEVRHDY